MVLCLTLMLAVYVVLFARESTRPAREAAVLRADRLGRPLPSWRQCRRLRPGELFLLSRTNPASFDSRYFGPVSASAVIGVARPVWLDSRP